MSENHSAKPKQRWFRRPPILIGLIICILVAGYSIFMLTPYTLTFPEIEITDKSSPMDVGEVFMYRLLRHDEEGVKKLTVEDAWPEIQKSMHDPPRSSCTTSNSHDSDGVNRLGEFVEKIDSAQSPPLTLSYFCMGSKWFLDLGDIEMQRIDGKWKIVSWHSTPGVVVN